MYLKITEKKQCGGCMCRFTSNSALGLLASEAHIPALVLKAFQISLSWSICISFLLVHNELPETYWIKITYIYFPVSMGQKAMHSLSGPSAWYLTSLQSGCWSRLRSYLMLGSSSKLMSLLADFVVHFLASIDFMVVCRSGEPAAFWFKHYSF